MASDDDTRAAVRQDQVDRIIQAARTVQAARGPRTLAAWAPSQAARRADAALAAVIRNSSREEALAAASQLSREQDAAG